MRLFKRIAVLLRADAHGIVESLEERSLLLKQYLREAEIEVDRNVARLAALRDEAAALGEALAREEATLEKLDDDVTLALEGGKDELARFAIRRLLSHRREASQIQRQREQRESEIAALAERVEEQQQRYEELVLRVRAEGHRDSHKDVERWCDPEAVAQEEVEIELIRRRSHVVPS